MTAPRRCSAYLVFVACQVAALAIAFPARREPLARISTIASGLLLLLSLLFVG